MLFCQMGGANSLREICGGLATAMGKLVHLGLSQAPTRSTLGYANAHRPWQLYQTVFEELLKSCQALAATKKRRFRFKHPLGSLDASIIELCVEVFDSAKFQRTKGAIKLHLQLDHQGCLPCWALVTDGDTNDVRVAQKLEFAPGTIVVMDRGYLDYALYERWTKTGVYFVTRPRTNMVYEVVEKREVVARGKVKSDEIIELTSEQGREALPEPIASSGGVGRRGQGRVGFSHQCVSPGGQHHWSDLQRSLADRTVFQSAQTKLKDQDFCGHQRERGERADLDRIDCHAVAQIPALEVQLGVELIESGSHAAL
jgi:hypothetical protein